MTMHGGVNGLTFYSSIEGVELRGTALVDGALLLTASNARSLASGVLSAAVAHQELVDKSKAANGSPEEQELVRQESEARREMELANAAEHEATQKWLALSRQVAIAKLKRLPKPYELTYSYSRCVCGARLAYWPDTNPTAWDCADVLLGNVGTEEDKAQVGEPPILGMGEPLPEKHEGKWVHRRLLFAFWKVKSDHTVKEPR